MDRSGSVGPPIHSSRPLLCSDQMTLKASGTGWAWPLGGAGMGVATGRCWDGCGRWEVGVATGRRLL